MILIIGESIIDPARSFYQNDNKSSWMNSLTIGMRLGKNSDHTTVCGLCPISLEFKWAKSSMTIEMYCIVFILPLSVLGDMFSFSVVCDGPLML